MKLKILKSDLILENLFYLGKISKLNIAGLFISIPPLICSLFQLTYMLVPILLPLFCLLTGPTTTHGKSTNMVPRPTHTGGSSNRGGVGLSPATVVRTMEPILSLFYKFAPIQAWKQRLGRKIMKDKPLLAYFPRF
jgi:hypothetical protein